MPDTQRQTQDYVEAHFPPERVRAEVKKSVRDHRALVARMLLKGSSDTTAVDATIRGLATLRTWQERLEVQNA